MRAKNEYKFLAEAYTQVNEGFDDVGKGPVRDAARLGAVEVDPISRISAERWADEGDPLEDPEDYWTPEGLEVGRRVTYETSKGNQSTGKVLEIGQDVVKIRDELAGEEKEILIKDILKVESELGEGPEVPSDHPLGTRSDWSWTSTQSPS